MPEVELPDSVASNGEKFISKSFLRKVAHLKGRDDVIANPIEGDLIKRLVGGPFSNRRSALGRPMYNGVDPT